MLGAQAQQLASLVRMESEFKAYVMQKITSNPCFRDAIIPTIENVLEQIRIDESLPASPCHEAFVELNRVRGLLEATESELEVAKTRLEQKEHELDDVKKHATDCKATGGSPSSIATRLLKRGSVRAQTQQAPKGFRNAEGPGFEKKEASPLAVHKTEFGMVTDSDSEPAEPETKEQIASLVRTESEVKAFVVVKMASNPCLREAIIPTIENALKQIRIDEHLPPPPSDKTFIELNHVRWALAAKESELEMAKVRLEQKEHELEDIRKLATGPKASGSGAPNIAARLRERGAVRAQAQQAAKFFPS